MVLRELKMVSVWTGLSLSNVSLNNPKHLIHCYYIYYKNLLLFTW